MTEPVLMAVDGGGSKTDVTLVRADGSVLALARGPRSSPHHLGLDGALDVLDRLLDEASAQARLPRRNGSAVAQVAHLLLAGVDFPAEEDEARAAVVRRGWAERTAVANDTFAVLRAGTERGWGVAVVCGAGINCVGVAPDGRHARFPSLGPITGDWGGGVDVGQAALFAAARSQDGRGPKTRLEQAVPEHFGLETPLEVAEAIAAITARVDPVVPQPSGIAPGPNRVRMHAEDLSGPRDREGCVERSRMLQVDLRQSSTGRFVRVGGQPRVPHISCQWAESTSRDFRPATGPLTVGSIPHRYGVSALGP